MNVNPVEQARAILHRSVAKIGAMPTEMNVRQTRFSSFVRDVFATRQLSPAYMGASVPFPKPLIKLGIQLGEVPVPALT